MLYSNLLLFLNEDSIKSRRQLFFIVFIFFGTYFCFFEKPIFYFDSVQYYSLGASFIKNGSFSLLNFESPLRGYSFPFLLLIFVAIPSKIFEWILGIDNMLFASLLVCMYQCFIMTLLLPHILSKTFGIKINNLQNLFFIGLVWYFWKSLIYFSLSDLWPIYSILGICYLLKKKNFTALLGAGALLAFCINTRPIYMIIIPIVLIYVIVVHKHRLIYFLLGAVLFLLPQFYINVFNFNKYSPLLQTQLKYQGIEYKGSLFLVQLNQGARHYKYETFVGTKNQYPMPGVRYINKEMEYFLQRNALDFESPFKSYSHWMNTLFQSPIMFIKSYAKTFFNGLDITYRDVYIEEITRVSLFLKWLNFSLIFLFGVIVLKHVKDKSISFDRIFCLALLLIPVLFTIVTRVELRFFLPIHLLIYITVISSMPDMFLEYSNTKIKNKILIAALYLLFMAVCLITSIKILNTIEYPISYIYGI